MTLSSRHIMLALFLVGLSFLCADCANSSQSPKAEPSPSPLTAAEKEKHFQQMYDYLDARTEARQAATAYAKATLPDWNVKGMACTEYAGHEFQIDVDLERGGQKTVLALNVRRFFPDSGISYWRAVPVDQERAKRLAELAADQKQ